MAASGAARAAGLDAAASSAANAAAAGLQQPPPRSSRPVQEREQEGHRPGLVHCEWLGWPAQGSVARSACQKTGHSAAAWAGARAPRTTLAALALCSTPPQLATAVGMVGLTYAAVPLYRMFCQVGAQGALGRLAGLPHQTLLKFSAGQHPSLLLQAAHLRGLLSSYDEPLLLSSPAGHRLRRHRAGGQGGGGQDPAARAEPG